MCLLLCRHGQTTANVQGLSIGRTGGKLTNLGKQQAQRLANFLSTEHIDSIYSSDLQRVKDTLQPTLRVAFLRFF